MPNQFRIRSASRMNSKTKKHRCTKDDIEWRQHISEDLADGPCVPWHGKCAKCGRKVYELYCQTDELYDATTDEDLDDMAEEE